MLFLKMSSYCMSMVLCSLASLFTTVSEYRYCFECLDSSNLASCTHVVICGDHEECFLEKVIASDGTTFFKQGCRDRQECSNRNFYNSGLGKKRSDTTTCSHCCDTDFCNYKGCGETGIADIHYQHLCLDCGNSLISGGNICHRVSLCRNGNTCSITKHHDLNTQLGYKFGCMPDSECSDMTNLEPCNRCCKGPFCNYKCSSGSTTAGWNAIQTRTTPTTSGWFTFSRNTPGITMIQTPSPTITPTKSSVTSLWQQLHDRNSTFCYSCNGVSSSSDCTDITHCGSHEQCYIQSAVTSDGHLVISSSCSPKSVCYPVQPSNSHDTVICHECCEGDFCNSRGCGQQVPSTYESRFCMSCQGVHKPEDCKKIVRCSTDELCMIKGAKDLNGENTIDLGCITKDTCPGIQNQQCSGCCKGAYCNKDCKTLEQLKMIQATTTTVGYSIRCIGCLYVRHISECHFHTTCQSGEICQLKELTGSDGRKSYRLGCAKEETCWQTEPHSRVGCCNFNDCNRNINILP